MAKRGPIGLPARTVGLIRQAKAFYFQVFAWITGHKGRYVVLFPVNPYLLPDQAGEAFHVWKQGLLVDVHLKKPLFDF